MIFRTLQLFLISTLLLENVSFAIIKSSAKECRVCHVLWFDEYLTSAKTIVEKKESAIVISGSTGLASSREMCESCHDGYVVDSRTRIVKGNPHETLKKIPEWLKLPEGFRVDGNNEIYCGTCHTLHDIQGHADVGSTPFLRMDNGRSEMCVACHDEKNDQQGYRNHPVQKLVKDMPFIETTENEGQKFGPGKEIVCESCHQIHKDKAMVLPFNDSALCVTCHKDKNSILNAKHDLRMTLPQSVNSNDKKPSDSGPCGACHIPHKANGKRLWARKSENSKDGEKYCLTCHGRQSVYNIKKTGDYSHSTDVVPGTGIKKTASLPLFKSGLEKSINGKIQCSTCHNVHQWDPGSNTEKGDKHTEGDTTNSFLRIANRSSSLCLECHVDKRELVLSDHNMNVTAPELRNIQNKITKISGPCGACHIIHNAKGNLLWARKPEPGNPVSGICLSCHSDREKNIHKQTGKYSHPIGIEPSKKKINVTAPLVLFSDNGLKNISGTLQCATCHNPHKWSAYRQSDNGGKNQEGDCSNSFLRISNKGSSALCIKCHENKKQVITSDHNLQVTAPDAENINGIKPSVSGPCGACHVPHNAFWKTLHARKFLSENEDKYIQLCTSCHTKTGPGKAKLTGENSHPLGITIEKLEIYRNIPENFLPLYDEENGKIIKGRITCLTCHDPHSWAPGNDTSVRDYMFKNIEGDLKNSFLRMVNAPSPYLCSACHTKNALIEGTDHDMRVSAPGSENLAGQLPDASGLCGTCHLVHNSPNNFKLWARPYGKTSEWEGIMNSMCRSCHSISNCGEKKIPSTALHPEGKLMTNIIRYGKMDKNYTPLFSRDGNEINYGNISCPSCHNPHQWGYSYKTKGDGCNREGDSTTSFLRNVSYNMICVDCHGLQSIWRYNYFHSVYFRVERIKQIKEYLNK